MTTISVGTITNLLRCCHVAGAVAMRGLALFADPPVVLVGYASILLDNGHLALEEMTTFFGSWGRHRPETEGKTGSKLLYERPGS